MKCLIAFISILLLVSNVQAASVTVDIYGTNVSNAQSNLTQTGNNSYTITAWGIGDATKRMQADINGNASDAITFTLHNLTVNRVIEVKVNGTSLNAYQTNSNGNISFTRTQTVRNQTYQFAPALATGGFNSTWGWFWNLVGFGNVGIGTTSPGSTLDVQAASLNTRFISTTGTNNVYSLWRNTGGDLYVGRVGSADDSILSGTLAYAGLVGSSGAYSLQFGSNGAVRMTIDSTGNVGIGRTVPTTRLDVAGTINATNLQGNGSGLNNLTIFSDCQIVIGANNTVYQNTNKTTIFVSVSATATSASEIEVYFDTFNPPTTLHQRGGNPVANIAGSVSFMVPKDYYYRYGLTGTSPSIVKVSICK